MAYFHNINLYDSGTAFNINLGNTTVASLVIQNTTQAQTSDNVTVTYNPLTTYSAIGINASGDYVKFVGAPAFFMTGNTDKCTIAGWMKVRDITPGNWAYNLGFEDGDTGSSNSVLHGYRNTDVAEFASTVETHTWINQPSQDTWYYFYITGANNGGGYILWKGGYYTASGSAPVEMHTNSAGANEYNAIRISVANDSYDEPLDSCLAYVRVWTGYELTDAELRAERYSANAVKTAGLWADWKLSNNTDTTDYSGSGHTLTFGGTITSENGPPLQPSLSVNNSTQLQTSDKISLAQPYILTVNNNSQLQTSSIVNLIQHQVLIINNTTQLQASGNITLIQHQVLAIDNSSQTQMSSNISLTQHHILSINNIIQIQISGNINLIQHEYGALVIQYSTQAQASSNITLDTISVRLNGARNFNGNTDRIDWDSIANLTSASLTIAAWIFPDRVNVNQYFFHIADTSDGIGIQFSNPGASSGSGIFQLARKGITTTGFRNTSSSALEVGKWTHILATSTGSLDYTTFHLYVNGTNRDTSSGVNTVGETTVTGKWSAGGRPLDDLRNVYGRIGEVAIWNRVLSFSEISLLSNRVDLKSATNVLDGLLFCIHPDEPKDLITNASGILDGTSLAYGPNLDFPDYSLTVNNATQLQTSDNVTVTYNSGTVTLTINNAIQLQTSDNVNLTQDYLLVINNATQLQTSDSISLIQHQILLINNATQAQTVNTFLLMPVRSNGARVFNGTTDRIDYSSKYTFSGSPVSISMWVQFDRINIYQILLNVQDVTNGSANFYLASPGNSYVGSIGMYMRASTFGWRTGSANTVAIGIWYNLIWTWDGTITSLATHAHIYKDGIEINYSNTQNGALPIADMGGIWSLGNVNYIDSSMFKGKIAEVAAWNRVLTAGEISQLSDRNNLHSATFIPNGLIFVEHPDEPKDLWTNEIGTLDGTTLTYGTNLEFPNYALSIDNATQLQTSNNINLTQHHILLINSVTQLQNSSNINLIQHEVGALVIQYATQAQTTSNIILDTIVSRINGARTYNGTGDRIDYTAKYDPTGLPITISAWIFSNGWVTPADYIFEVHTTSDVNTGLSFYLSGTNQIEFSRRGSTTLFRSGIRAGISFTGSWRHVLVTHDGSDSPYTNIKLYIDGTECTSYVSGANGITLATQNGSWSVGGRIFDNTRNFDGKIGEVAAWNRVLTVGEISTLSNRTVLESATNIPVGLVFVEHPDEAKDLWTGEIGTITGTSLVYGPDLDFPNYALTVNNSTQTQTSNNVILTSHYIIIPNNTTQLQISDNINLIQDYILSINNATQLQTSDKVNLTQHYVLSINNSVQTQTADNITLTFNPGIATITVQNTTQAQTSDNIALTQHHVLSVNNAVQLQTANKIDLTQHEVGALIVNNTTQLQTSGNVILTQHQVLAIQNSTQVQTSDNVNLTQDYVLAIQNATQLQISSNIILTQHQVLAINNINQLQTSDNIVLTQHTIGSLNINNATQLQTSTNINLIQHQVLAMQNATQLQTANNISLFYNFTLAINNATQLQTAQSVNLTQDYVLSVNNATQLQTAGNVNLIQHQILAIQNTVQLQIADNANLGAHYVLSTVNNTSQLQTSDKVSLLAHYALATVNNATQLQTSSSPLLKQNYLLAVQNATQLQTSSTIISRVTISIDSAIQLQTADSLTIFFHGQHYILGIFNALQGQSANNINLKVWTIVFLTAYMLRSMQGTTQIKTELDKPSYLVRDMRGESYLSESLTDDTYIDKSIQGTSYAYKRKI